MSKLRVLMSLMILCWLAAGCASQPSYQKIQAELPALSGDAGRIYIYTPIRDTFLDFVPEVLVNGKSVGMSRSGTFLVLDRPPGEYTIEAAQEASFAAFGNQKASVPARISLKKGETAYVRLHMLSNELFAQVKSIPEDAAAGQLELRTLSYQGGNAMPAGG